MSPKTPLDTAFDAMEAAPNDESVRANYYSVLAASELFVLLEHDPGESFEPQLVELEGARFALVFDSADKLAEFCDEPSPYIAMSGRELLRTVTGARLGLAVNPGLLSSMFVPVEAVEWSANRASAAVSEGDAKIREISAPEIADAEMLRAIDARLAVYSGNGRCAYLVKATYDTESAHLMILAGMPPEARAGVAGGLAEALRFLLPDIAFDTMFVEEGAQILTPASRVGLKFDMDAPDRIQGPGAPGTDPDKPPILH